MRVKKINIACQALFIYIVFSPKLRVTAGGAVMLMNEPMVFVLAGPQCAGKSTVKNYLYARYMRQGTQTGQPPRNLVLLQEMRQLIMHERGIHSGIFIDRDAEEEIVRRDLERLEMVVAGGKGLIYLDETSVFTLAHASLRGLPISQPLDHYRSLFRPMQTAVIYLRIAPSMSWTRRKPKYEERVAGYPIEEAATVLKMYREYLEQVDVHLQHLKEQIGVRICEIDASGPLEDTLRRCAKAFIETCEELKVPIQARF